jgi:SAM-dependent methyltransferase
MAGQLFESRVELYDALIDWPKRLANEEAFFRAVFEQVGARRVVDVACGTGHHAALFNSWGLDVEGADISPAMIERCRRQFGESAALSWTVRGFDEPPPVLDSFDAAICIGNSLALAPDTETIARAMTAMLRAVRAGGVCIVQVLNLWQLPDGPCVWQKTVRQRLHGEDHVLVKGVHRCGARGYVELIDLELTGAAVDPRFDRATFLGLATEQLQRLAMAAGAASVRFCGDFQQTAYSREQSQDLIMVAMR